MIEFLGHIFIDHIHTKYYKYNLELDYFECTKCNVIIYELVGNYYYSLYQKSIKFDKNNAMLIQTCDEIIIKSIIE